MGDKPILLDCSLRDGGYYNKWNFTDELINKYLKAMSLCGIDYIEIGFKSIENETFKGPCAYSTEEFISNLEIPNNLKLSAMVNASELTKSISINNNLGLLFNLHSKDSFIDLVRIASKAADIEKLYEHIKYLKELGYLVALNIMQISELSKEEITYFAKILQEYPIDVLYIADSMGCLNPENIESIINIILKNFNRSIGVHTHDNLGLALANTIRSLAVGASWLDSTVLGIGRGPGNTKTEELIIELNSSEKNKFSLYPLLNLIKNDFQPLKNQYKWGQNPFYYLSGKYKIHPSYIQEMLSDERFNYEDILAVIEKLKNINSKSFTYNKLEAARNFYTSKSNGVWSPSEKLEEKEVLLLGTGPGVKKHKLAIEDYISRKNPIVIAINTQNNLSSNLIDLRIACHPVRLIADLDFHKQNSSNLILPFAGLPEYIKNNFDSIKILDYGLNVIPNKFESSQKSCILPVPLVLAYSLAVLTSGKVKRALLAGFDGYPAGDPRNQETSRILEIYREFQEKDFLLAVTPTIHRIKQASIYSKEL